MSEKKVTCGEVMSHICESLGEELATQRCKEIREHLKNCTCCQQYFESVEMTIDFYKKYNFTASDEICKNLLKKLNLE